jgi:four helix bundle protein
MSLKVAEVAYEVIAELRPLLPRIKRADRSLAEQLLRAANSMVLNIGEAQYSDPGNARSRFYTAAGSANETRSALRLATSWGHISAEQVERSHKLLDEVMAMLWCLSRRSG